MSTALYNAMSAAMASGDVQISFSQGVTPFLVATAAGQDLKVVDIAVCIHLGWRGSKREDCGILPTCR